MRDLVIARSPLRISFVGGGSDIPSVHGSSVGSTVSVAINRYVYAVAKRRDDEKVIVQWRHREEVDHFSALQHDLIRESLRSFGIEHGVEIITFADIPGVGSGLGSSAATLCAVCRALAALSGFTMEGSDLAEWTSNIEMKILRRGCGRQDHYASALGGFQSLYFEDGRVVSLQRVKAHSFTEARIPRSFLLFSPRSGAGRQASSVLSGMREINDADTEWRESCVACCNGFVNMVERRKLDEAAYWVTIHHRIKREQFPGYMDDETNDRLSAMGFNFKLCGAGGTGHVLAYAPLCQSIAMRAQMESAWGPEIPWEISQEGSKVVYEQ